MSANLPVYVVEMQPVEPIREVEEAAAAAEPWTELSCWIDRADAVKTMSVYASGEPHMYGPFGCRRLRVREVTSHG